MDIYPEDMCAHCRMAVSDQRFACEVVTSSGEALKFDDIGCMEKFLEARGEEARGEEARGEEAIGKEARGKEGAGKELSVAGVFYKDYGSGSWIPAASATIVETGLMTPMGSGKVAFADGREAEKLRTQHPPTSRN